MRLCEVPSTCLGQRHSMPYHTVPASSLLSAQRQAFALLLTPYQPWLRTALHVAGLWGSRSPLQASIGNTRGRVKPMLCL